MSDETNLIDDTHELRIPLSRKVSTAAGGNTDTMVLREPQLRHVMISEKECENLVVPHTLRARDIKLTALVSGVTEADIRDMPISLFTKATDFLRGYVEFDIGVEHDTSADDMLIQFEKPIKAQDGQEYAALMLEEPTAAAMESAEKALRSATNLFTVRQYQQILISKCGDLPAALVPQLPISVVNRAAKILGSFSQAGQAAGEI